MVSLKSFSCAVVNIGPLSVATSFSISDDTHRKEAKPDVDVFRDLSQRHLSAFLSARPGTSQQIYTKNTPGISSNLFEASSNVRAITIFSTYLSTCTLLTSLLVRDLLQRYRRRRNDIPKGNITTCALFAVLASLSLATTWRYMLQFFSLSYHAWAHEHGINVPARPQTFQDLYSWVGEIHLGSWLGDVKLFREAWEIAMESYGRLVWSQPIFFITTIWAFFIGEQGT